MRITEKKRRLKNLICIARLRMPKGKVAMTVSVNKELSDWYQAQGEESKALISTTLKINAEAH